MIDSSSGPTPELVPLSNGGTMIMGIVMPVLGASTLMLTQIEVFVLSAVMNYYAIAALVLLWLIILMGLDFSGMCREDLRAVQGHGHYGANGVV